MRQIDQIIGGPQETKANKTFEKEKVQADLKLIKLMLHHFNAVCKNRRDDFESDKVPIDNKWIHYPQYPIPDFTSCKCQFLLMFNEILVLSCIRYGRTSHQRGHFTH